ncbi:hypothetical protein K438DRAFT_226142 [Mycena galopus ATCC 62051]|nr:hypothetical protein K438DRAFT_226142 [Mycena galopus ATCC 62051]
MQSGFTKGPGQRRPGNLSHLKKYWQLLQLILGHLATRRIAGFQSSGLARYFPKLYQDYKATMEGLLQKHPDLQLPFSNSVFPTATFNLGPQVVTPEHLDVLNNPHGVCGVTSGGKYNHKLGGHLYLKQLKFVCEFPSGSTVLLLSAACEHGNTPIQAGETRYSMTQYAAGGLFRWAAYGYQSEKALLSQPNGAKLKHDIDGGRAARALGFLLMASELEADRKAVFGMK